MTKFLNLRATNHEIILCAKESNGMLLSLSQKFSIRKYTFIFPYYNSPSLCIAFSSQADWYFGDFNHKTHHSLYSIYQNPKWFDCCYFPYQFMIPPNQVYLQLPHLPSLQALPAKSKSNQDFTQFSYLRKKGSSKSRPDSVHNVVLIHLQVFMSNKAYLKGNQRRR